jgi:hypothetical protein
LGGAVERVYKATMGSFVNELVLCEAAGIRQLFQ